MKNFNEGFTVVLNKQSGNSVSSKGDTNKQAVALTDSGAEVWFPMAAQQGKKISFKLHEVGDTFTATRNSKRTKLQGWLNSNKDAVATDCPLTEDEQTEPLYLKGDVVTRTASSVEFIGFTEIELTFEQKLVLAQKYGIQVKF